jgi:hypothetical protein
MIEIDGKHDRFIHGRQLRLIVVFFAEGGEALCQAVACFHLSLHLSALWLLTLFDFDG